MGTQAKFQKPVKDLMDKASDLRDIGKFYEAINLLKSGVSQYPSNPNLLALLSHCHILNDEIEEAAKKL